MKDLNFFIDHTLLKPFATTDDIVNLCEEADKYQFASVCVLPYFVKLAKDRLLTSKVAVGTVIGFPLGGHVKNVKVFEAKQALKDGAEELDVVINIAALKSKDYDSVAFELDDLRKISYSITLKAILETCYLTQDEIIKACEIASSAGFDFVKTSTGFGSSGAKIEDVKLMKKSTSKHMQVKASGGIKDYKTCLEFIEAGATRIGTSQALDIVKNQV